jgi:hypothetical protein
MLGIEQGDVQEQSIETDATSTLIFDEDSVMIRYHE